jgi:hypothetical protein
VAKSEYGRQVYSDWEPVTLKWGRTRDEKRTEGEKKINPEALKRGRTWKRGREINGEMHKTRRKHRESARSKIK